LIGRSIRQIDLASHCSGKNPDLKITTAGSIYGKNIIANLDFLKIVDEQIVKLLPNCTQPIEYQKG